MTRLRADGLLLIAAVVWGTAFIAQKAANDVMGPISFVGARFLFSALLVLPLTVIEARKAPVAITPRDLMLAGAIGLCLFTGSILQQIALLTTTATNGGFLTALYVVLVPITTWILTRERVRLPVLLACVISITGAYLLSSGGLDAFALGDVLLLLSDVAWAFAISLIGVFLQRAPRPFFLALLQYSITAILGIAAGLAFEPVTLSGLEAALPAILYAGIISGGLAFTLQLIAQRYTPAPEAAVIMSLESVTAAIAGAIVLGERLQVIAMVGCVLILAGVLIAEVGPALLRKARGTSAS